MSDVIYSKLHPMSRTGGGRTPSRRPSRPCATVVASLPVGGWGVPTWHSAPAAYPASHTEEHRRLRVVVVVGGKKIASAATAAQLALESRLTVYTGPRRSNTHTLSSSLPTQSPHSVLLSRPRSVLRQYRAFALFSRGATRPHSSGRPTSEKLEPCVWYNTCWWRLPSFLLPTGGGIGKASRASAWLHGRESVCARACETVTYMTKKAERRYDGWRRATGVEGLGEIGQKLVFAVDCSLGLGRRLLAGVVLGIRGWAGKGGRWGRMELPGDGAVAK